MHLAAFIALIFFINLYPHRAKASSAAGQETLIGIIGRDYILLGADSSLSSSISLTSSNVDKIKIISNPFPFGNDMSKEYGDNHDKRYDNDHLGQQVIAVATAGDMADSERLVGNLAARVTQMEYESILGSDVRCIFDGRTDGLESSGDSNVRAGSFLTRSACSDAKSVAFLARGQIAEALRSRSRLNTCILVGGMVPMMNKDGYEMEGTSNFSRRIQDQVQKTTTEKMNIPDESEYGGNRSKNEDVKEIKKTLLEPCLFWLDEYGSLQQIEYGAHGLGSNFILSILDRRYSRNLSKDDGIQLVKDCFEQLRTRYIINCPEKPCIKCIDSNGCQVVS